MGQRHELHFAKQGFEIIFVIFENGVKFTDALLDKAIHFVGRIDRMFGVMQTNFGPFKCRRAIVGTTVRAVIFFPFLTQLCTTRQVRYPM